MKATLDPQTAQLLEHLRRGGNYSYFWAASHAKDERDEAILKVTTWVNGSGPKETPDDHHPQHGPIHLYFGVHPTMTLPKERRRDGKMKPVNPATARAVIEEIASVNCLFGEFDAKDFGGSKAAAWAHVEGLPAMPSVIIDSGAGYHCYWLLDTPFLIKTPAEREHVKQIQYRWVDFVKSDQASKDLARVLRVPGTLNYKYNPPRPITYVSADFTRLYTLDTLEGELPAPEPRKKVQPAGTTLNLVGDAQRAQSALGRLSPDRYENYDKWIACGMALASLGETGRDLWMEWSKGSDKFDEDQCLAKWDTFKIDPTKLTLGSLFHWANQDDPANAPKDDFHTTDLGNAQRFLRDHGENVRYIHAWGCWYIWNNRCWEKDETGAINRLASDTVKRIWQEAADAAAAGDDSRKALGQWAKQSESRDRLSAMVTLAQDHVTPTHYKELDAKEWLMPCRNGTINLRTGKLQLHNRADLLTKCIPVNYDPHAAAPTWEAFVALIMDNDQDLITFLQRATGYTLTGDTSEQCLFFAYGSGKNGKSTFIETIKSLLGDYAQKAPADMLMQKQGGSGVPNDVARLPGARFVVASEIEEGRRLAESMIKDLTGGDTMAARFMRQEFFEFVPTHKLWIYGNHKPLIRGTDEGIWRRMRLIPFQVFITPEIRDPHLKTKLQAELSGILAWMVRGCLDWQKSGFSTPAAVENATNAYRSEMDILGQFLDDTCVPGRQMRVECKALYAAYVAWCEMSGEHPVAQRRFGGQVTERRIERERTSHGWFYLGIGLVTTRQPPPAALTYDPNDLNDLESGMNKLVEKTHGTCQNLDHLDHLDHEVAARGPATWHASDADFPIEVTGVLGTGTDGRIYVATTLGDGGVPLDEIEFQAPASACRVAQPIHKPNVNERRARQQEEAELAAIGEADEELF